MSKLIYAIVLFSCLTSFSHAQIQAVDDTWSAVGNVQVRWRLDDADNGDGIGDGAISIDGRDTNAPHGITYEFQGTPSMGDVIDIDTSVYNYTASYVRYYVQLFNVTDNQLLIASNLVTIVGGVTAAVSTSLNYTALASDAGDVLQLRYIRGSLDGNGDYIGTDGHEARDFAIDSASLNGQLIAKFERLYLPRPVLDIAPEFPSAQQQTDMDRILNDLSDWMLGLSPPSSTELDEAIVDYNNLNIIVSNDEITGMLSDFPLSFSAWRKAGFLMAFAQHLKFNPNDSTVYANGLTVQEMSSRTIWLFARLFYSSELPEDHLHYAFKQFAIPAVYLLNYLSVNQTHYFDYAFYKHNEKFGFFWSPTYDIGLYGHTGTINIDHIGNTSHVQLAYGLMRDSGEERLQWAKGFKRYYERFFSDTPGTTDGIKSDGSSFHHNSALNNYSYNYNTPMKVVSILTNTPFQITQTAYRTFRNVVYTQLFLANDNVEPLSMSGRHPDSRGIAVSKARVLELADAGATILGLSEADSVLTGAYARLWDLPGVSAEKLSGFAQFNYHTAGAYWSNEWLAVARGETNWGFGAEIFRLVSVNNNLYGRYQSYGSLEIIYRGGQINGNGFHWNGWDWNFNPGATTIVLPWELLRAEYSAFQQELQQENFTGSLAFDAKSSPVLPNIYGETGVFAMNFIEDGDHWGAGEFIEITHEESFRFKKTVFFFKDFLLALGSNINNDDSGHMTVTTLFQRLADVDPSHSEITVDDVNYSNYEEVVFSENADHWLIDNFSTGYYVVNGSGELHTRRSLQVTPKEASFDLTDNASYATSDNFVSYLNHGSAPIDSDYEFVIKPDTSNAEMLVLASSMLDENTKPYAVYQKNENAHIVKDKLQNLYALALFSSNSVLPNVTLIKANSKACLIQYQESSDQTVKLSLSNPDLGFTHRSYDASVSQLIDVELNGKWALLMSYPNARITSQGNDSTTIEFTTFDGLPIEISLVDESDVVFKSSFENVF